MMTQLGCRAMELAVEDVKTLQAEKVIVDGEVVAQAAWPTRGGGMRRKSKRGRNGKKKAKVVPKAGKCGRPLQKYLQHYDRPVRAVRLLQFFYGDGLRWYLDAIESELSPEQVCRQLGLKEPKKGE